MHTVSHSKIFVMFPTACDPIILLSAAMRVINISKTGKIRPPINCEFSIISIKPMFGIKTITSERAIIAVKSPLKVGASLHLKSTPASQPKASQTTKDVVSGKTQAAKKDAATNPTPKRISAYSPAKGANARAASSAVSTLIPCGNNTVPVVTIINHATASATTEPEIASTRPLKRSFLRSEALAPLPFSTTLLCTKNNIHGAIVVPNIAIVRLKKLPSGKIVGTSVCIKATSQLGLANTAAIT